MRFVFGYEARPTSSIGPRTKPDDLYQQLTARADAALHIDGARRPRPERVKDNAVAERGYKNIRTVDEDITEFTYRPRNCEDVGCRRPTVIESRAPDCSWHPCCCPKHSTDGPTMCAH